MERLRTAREELSSNAQAVHEVFVALASMTCGDRVSERQRPATQWAAVGRMTYATGCYARPLVRPRAASWKPRKPRWIRPSIWSKVTADRRAPMGRARLRANSSAEASPTS